MQGNLMSNPFQEQLDEAFPASADANVIRAVAEGIMLADKTLDNETFLKSLVGQDLRGHIRRAGVLFRLHQMASIGDLPFDSTMSQMPRGNWHWIELRSKNFTSHVCRTDGPNLFPTDTPTRQDDRLTNQGDLFRTSPVVVPIKGYVSWLTFGVGDSGALSHLCWGMPNAKEDIWLARSNIIRRASEADVVVKFEPPAKPDLKFRDHIEESLQGKDEDQGEVPA
jgi:hypothetical protein